MLASPPFLSFFSATGAVDPGPPVTGASLPNRISGGRGLGGFEIATLYIYCHHILQEHGAAGYNKRKVSAQAWRCDLLLMLSCVRK